MALVFDKFNIRWLCTNHLQTTPMSILGVSINFCMLSMAKEIVVSSANKINCDITGR